MFLPVKPCFNTGKENTGLHISPGFQYPLPPPPFFYFLIVPVVSNFISFISETEMVLFTKRSFHSNDFTTPGRKKNNKIKSCSCDISSISWCWYDWKFAHISGGFLFNALFLFVKWRAQVPSSWQFCQNQYETPKQKKSCTSYHIL